MVRVALLNAMIMSYALIYAINGFYLSIEHHLEEVIAWHLGHDADPAVDANAAPVVAWAAVYITKSQSAADLQRQTSGGEDCSFLHVPYVDYRDGRI